MEQIQLAIRNDFSISHIPRVSFIILVLRITATKNDIHCRRFDGRGPPIELFRVGNGRCGRRNPLAQRNKIVYTYKVKQN